MRLTSSVEALTSAVLSTEGAQYCSQGQASTEGSTEGAKYGSQGQALAKRRASPLDSPP